MRAGATRLKTPSPRALDTQLLQELFCKRYWHPWGVLLQRSVATTANTTQREQLLHIQTWLESLERTIDYVSDSAEDTREQALHIQHNCSALQARVRELRQCVVGVRAAIAQLTQPPASAPDPTQ